MIFYGSKMDVARFATEAQISLEKDLPLTTITRVGKSGVYSVCIVTDGLSVDTVKTLARTCSLQDINISTMSTVAGLSLAGRKRKDGN